MVQWSGDTSILGWLTTAGYLIAAFLCGFCAWWVDSIYQDGITRQHRFIWGGLGLGLFFLGLNKQLDLQTNFTRWIKTIASNGGWYQYGQRLQEVFILVMFAASLGLALGIGYWIRSVWKQYWLLLLAGLIIARFVIVRAATFYGVALPKLSRFTGGIQINWLLEITGVLLIIGAALWNLRKGWLRYRDELHS